MKRFFAFICALVLLFTSFPAMTVFATETDFVADNTDLIEVKPEEWALFPNLRPNIRMFKASRASLEHDLPDGFLDYLKEHFGNCEASFSIEQFNIPYSRWEELKSVIWYETPELFHISGLGCYYNSSTDTIVEITAYYRPFANTAAAYQDCLDKMLDGAEYLLRGVKENDDLTDVEKALLLHDRLAVWTEYDLGNMYTADATHKIFTAYSALGEGLSVCQGYAMAYMYLLDQVGIESDYCSSSELYHGWNIVYIDGVAYHVDVTWDDPVNGASATYYDDYGRVYHDNFLLSSDGIWNSGHMASDYNDTPSDSRYDNKGANTWWMDSNTAIQLIDNNLYYLDNNSGKVMCADDGSAIYSHTDYSAAYKLSSAEGMLLCSTYSNVQAIDPETGISSVVYTPNYGYIEGMKYEKDKLWVQLNDGAGNSSRKSVDYVKPENTDYTYTVNDGEVTIIGYNGTGGDITIPDTLGGYPVTTIGASAFEGFERLTSVIVGTSVTTIGDYAFCDCTSLTSVTIPDSVITIGDSTFNGCDSLTNVYITDVASWCRIDFDGYSSNPLYYANNLFVNGIPIGDLVIPDSVTIIGDYAFSSCANLTSVTIPDSVTTIGYSVFSSCANLTTVTIPDSVTTIGDWLFCNCTSLTTISIPDNITTIGEWVFASCSSLKSISVPDSVTAIGDFAFFDCTGLADVYYGGSQTQWNAIAIGDFNEDLLEAKIHITGEHTHSYTKKVTKPTCTAKGYTTYTCTCGDTYKSDHANALGHSYSAATCTKAKTCARCKVISGKALGHTYKSGSCTRCKYKPAGAKITTQPKNVAVSSGKTAKVSVKASGTGLKYVWYMAKKGSSKFTKTTVTTASYSVKMSSSVNGQKVYCQITDSYGNVIKSSTVTLYKGTAAKITTQPKGITVASGKTGKLTVKASGSSLKYQWYVKYKGASSYTKVGKNSKTYSFTMASKFSGAQAYCVVKDKYGIEVKSSVVTIKLAAKPKITTQPKSVTQVSGKTVKFLVKASGEGLKYQWYYAKKGSSSFKKLSGKTSATYSVKVSSSVNGRKYYCKITDKYGQTVKSSTVTLTMKTVAKITTQPKNVTVKNGKTAKVTIKAVGDGLKYTWYYLKPGATKYVKASATGASYSVKMAAAWKNAKVYCMIADKYGNTVKSSVVTLKMK